MLLSVKMLMITHFCQKSKHKHKRKIGDFGANLGSEGLFGINYAKIYVRSKLLMLAGL